MTYVVARLKKNKDGQITDTQYYSGYNYLPNKATNGINWVNAVEEAYEFETKLNAENWLSGEAWRSGGDCVVQELKRKE